MQSKNKIGAASIALVMLMFFSIAGSIWSGDRLAQVAQDEWLKKFHIDAARLTDGVLFWTSKTKVNLRAISSQMKAQGISNQETFLELIDEASAWDPDVTFDSVGFAERVMRPNREAFEAEYNSVLKNATSPEEPAPEVYESFVVTMASVEDGFLKPMNDLTTHPALKTTVNSAFRLPGHVILGPTYVGQDSHRKVLIATASSILSKKGVMVAELDISSFFSVYAADMLPVGLKLRLIERDSDARAESIYFALIGNLQPSKDVIETKVLRIVSGQARWDLNWDVTSEYLGGPSNFAAFLLQVGGTMLSILLFGTIGYLTFQNIRFHTQVADQTAALSQNSMIVQLTMDSIDQGFAVWNADQRLVVWSRCCYDFWLEPPESVLRVGMHMSDLLTHLVKAGAFGDDADKSTVNRELQRVSAAGQSSEDHLILPGGRHVHVRRFPLERGGYVAVYTDITEQEEAAKHLNLANESLEKGKQVAEAANRAKSEFLSSMSHELRTPMNAILGFAQLLEFNPKEPLTEHQKSSVDHIMKGGQHLLGLIDEILDLAKIESGKLNISAEVINLHEVCRECLSLMATQIKARDLSIDDDLRAARTIKADHTRFKQVLLNLLSNAVKYNREKGAVTLTCTDTPNNRVRVSVADSGIGIAANEEAGLFEPFNRLGKDASEIEGTGIGLTITKKLVEAMGGEIGFESELGKGSTFWIEFPAIENTAIKQGKQNEVSEKDEHLDQASMAATVLYIEDTPANLKLVEMIINRIGGTSLISAHNAELGISMAKENQPDLILMDINLPGMDGIAAMKVLSTIEETRDIPVIAVTAAAMQIDIDKGMAAGFKAYLTKPLNVPEVIAAIKKELGA